MYFFDTYAIIEMWKGNPKYVPFEEFPFVVSAINIGEFYEFLIRALGENKAEYFLKLNTFQIIDIDKEMVLEAVKFRIKNKKKNISWADSIGYVLAKKNHLRFLTGDSQFKDLPNVEFVQ